MGDETLKLAALKVLARSVEGSRTFEEVEREAKLLAASLAPTNQLKRFAALGEVDIFEAGLVLEHRGGLQITELGRSLLDSLRSSNLSPHAGSTRTTQDLKLIDHPIGHDARLKVFDLGVRDDDDAAGAIGDATQPQEDSASTTEPVGARFDDFAEDVASEDGREEKEPELAGHENRVEPIAHENYEAIVEPPEPRFRDIPVSVRQGFGYRPNDSEPSAKS